jgi:hypothetical protein
MDDIPSRVRGARLRREHPLPRTWSEVFDESFFHNEMAGYLGEGHDSIVEERMIA